MIPPKANSAFLAAMEDVLAVYLRPHHPDRVLVCLDETSKQLIAETRVPIPMKPGRAARVDYEYERNGTANLFMLFAPLEGWRHIKVTDRHTAVDYAPSSTPHPSCGSYVGSLVLHDAERNAAIAETAGLIARGEAYGPHSIPHQVLVLTVGVDVQGDRLEIVIIGWGEHDESWVIDHQVIFGDPAQSDAWAQLDALLRTSYQNQYGHELRIRSCCVDSGGHHATQVIDFCKARWRRRIYATKGQAGMRPIWPKRASRTRNHEALYVLGVDTAKDTIYNRLRITKPGPGYIHFPAGDVCDETFFEQLTSEQLVTRKREGRPYRVWVLPSGKRKEILDCVVLALAAYRSAPTGLEGQLAPAALAPAPSGVTITTPGVSLATTKRLYLIREMARRMNPPR